MPYVCDEISFPEGDGLVIINGQNGHGKTSLLEALRFVFFSKIQGSNDLFACVNSEGFQNGNYEATVTLDVEYLGEDYKIIRRYAPKKGKVVVTSGDDYDPPTVEVVALSRGGVLSDEEGKRLLSKIMSESVSRFYLFDGELLEEYQRILSGTNREESRKVKQAIENLLGLPILTNTRNHIKIIQDELKKELTQKSKKTSGAEQRLLTIMADQRNKISYYEEEAQTAHSEYLERVEQIREIDDILSASQDDVEKTQKVAVLNQQLLGFEEDLKKSIEDRSTLLKKAWMSLLYPFVVDKNEMLSKNLDSKKATLTEINTQKALMSDFEKSLSAGKCSQCQQQLNSDALQLIMDELNKLRNTSVSPEEEREIKKQILELEEMVKDLRTFTTEYNSDLRTSLIEARNHISQINTDIDNRKVELAQYRDQLKGANLTEEKYQELRAKRDVAEREKFNWEETYNQNLKLKEDAERHYNNASQQLAATKNLNVEVQKLMKKDEYVSDLYNLFETSIDKYRNLKREEVQRSASDLFCKLSTFDYVGGMNITEDYTIEPYTKEGKPLSRLSGGYLRLAAYALIGGLQQNVPIKGPLFMDTPAGNLDTANTRNLIQCLPDLSKQVILFIHDKDIKREDVHHYHSDKICREYIIEKISDTRSEIRLLEE